METENKKYTEVQEESERSPEIHKGRKMTQ